MRTDRWLLLFVALAFSSTARAEIYFDKDKDGEETCEDSRKETLRRAVTEARSLANDAATYMSTITADPKCDRRNYVTWFGAYDDGRAATVARNFEAIQRALRDQDIYFDCYTNPLQRCGEMMGVGAYVDRNSSLHRIYVCNKFWGYPESGTLSQGGTMLHEMSHFVNVAGTLDIDGYQSFWSCQTLADSDPAKAITSSYNHQLFAETHPLIPPCGPCSIGRRSASVPPHASWAVALLPLLCLLLRSRRRLRRSGEQVSR